VISFLFLIWNARNLNVLSLGGEQAVHLGINVNRMHASLYLVASLLTAVLVSYAGSIGFVGLMVPHICRVLVGSDHRILLPSALFSGAIILMLSDLIARSVLAPAEIPVGAVTAVIGAPMFMYLLRRNAI
jgi:iron complex transport system permease protein